MPTAKLTAIGNVYRIKITLKHVQPSIWRRLEVAGYTKLPKLPKLHEIIQIAMGWTDTHLHQFIAGRETYGAPIRNGATTSKMKRPSSSNKLRRKTTAWFTNTTSATAGRTSSTSRPSPRPKKACAIPVASPANAPARPKTAAARRATKICCKRSPTRRTKRITI